MQQPQTTGGSLVRSIPPPFAVVVLQRFQSTGEGVRVSTNRSAALLVIEINILDYIRRSIALHPASAVIGRHHHQLVVAYWNRNEPPETRDLSRINVYR